VALGHSVEVFAGPPWPELDDGVGFTAVPSLDLYRDPDPFRIPMLGEFKTREDVEEFAIMLSAGFGEPLTFSHRVEKILKVRRSEFDIIHDNQCLGNGIVDLVRDGWPLLETLHHPITVDRSIALDHSESWRERLGTRRWFGFLRMQARVARAVPAILTVSHNSKADIHAQLGVKLDKITVVPVGVDHEVFAPQAEVVKVKGRIMVTSSSDVPMKGLVPLLEAVAKLRRKRDLSVTLIGRPRANGRVAKAIERLGLGDVITEISGVSDQELARLYAEAEVAVVPSLYEGFSLPAIEAMSCGVAVVGTTGGAIPEVIGTSGETGLLVEPNDSEALRTAIERVLDDESLRNALGVAGRNRVVSRFTWQVTARGTQACYEAILGGVALPESLDFEVC
jgi:glycosyltransferase involved in cell wall biosynthesis